MISCSGVIIQQTIGKTNRSYIESPKSGTQTLSSEKVTPFVTARSIPYQAHLSYPDRSGSLLTGLVGKKGWLLADKGAKSSRMLPTENKSA